MASAVAGLRRFRASEGGQGLVEYAPLLALAVMTALVGLQALAGVVHGVYGEIRSRFTG
ncbi:MAG: hypothetical protein QMC81_07780 [Thermoanaerobacterales bacterium]|nr:hypothetical protein [Thermoanaerobacterales bacterium]